MSFTRAFQAGAEVQHINELDELGAFGSTSGAAVSSTKANTGTYSFRTSSTSYPRGRAITATQLRTNAYINHAGLSGANSSYKAVVFVIPCTGITSVYVIWNGGTGNLELYVNDTLRASVTAATQSFSTTATWWTVGVTHKAHATTGFASVYINGVQVLTYTGNTGTAATGVYWGGWILSGVGGWANYMYFDDFYIDVSDGSDSDAVPPSPTFPWQAANAAGTSAAWTVSGAASNHLAVDEGVPNDDTDYVNAGSSGLIDYYNTANTTVPAGKSVVAVIPTVRVKRTDVSVASQIKIGTRLSGTNVDGSAQTPSGVYAYLFERHTTKPGGGAWAETDVNSAELKIESAGSF